MAWTMVAVMVVLGLRRPLHTLFVVLFSGGPIPYRSLKRRKPLRAPE